VGIDATPPPSSTRTAGPWSRLVRALVVVVLLMVVAAVAASASPRPAERPAVQEGGAALDAIGLPDPPEPVTPAPVPSGVDVDGAVEAVGASALASLPFDPAVEIPGWEIVFLPGRDDIRALARPDQRRIEVHVRPDDTADGLRRVIAHELGHALDVERLDDADRARWRSARGVGLEVPWWPRGTTYDFDTMAGDFAEAVAAWMVGSESVSQVGGPFTPEQLAVVEELIG
jgi:hypothetical protein